MSANPNGAACYDASVRYHSSLPMTGERGARDRPARGRAARRGDEGDRRSGRSAPRDVPTLLQHARTEKRYLFKSRDELIARSQAALARAKDRIHDWFGLLPKADVVIERVSEVPREERAERIQSAGRGRQPSGGVLHQRLPRPRRRAGSKRSRPRSTRRFRATTCRARSRSSARSIHPIGRYLGNAGYRKAGRCTPSGSPTR